MGYTPSDAKVKFIVYWQREDSDYKIRIVLPEIHFKLNPIDKKENIT